jgi:hypothetical protein
MTLFQEVADSFKTSARERGVLVSAFFYLHRDMLLAVVWCFCSSEGYLCVIHLLWYSWLDEFNLRLRIQVRDFELDPGGQSRGDHWAKIIEQRTIKNRVQYIHCR